MQRTTPKGDLVINEVGGDHISRSNPSKGKNAFLRSQPLVTELPGAWLDVKALVEYSSCIKAGPKTTNVKNEKRAMQRTAVQYVITSVISNGYESR